MSEAKFVTDVKLVDISDSDHIFFPKGCTVEQIVIQRTPELPGEKRYYVNSILWDQLSASNRAGLILHEVLFRHALLNIKTKSSRLTRFLTGITAANKISILSFEEYYLMLKKDFNFRYTNIDGQLAESVSFFEDGDVRSYTAVFKNDKVFTLPNGLEIEMPAKSSAYIKYSDKDFIKSVEFNNTHIEKIILSNRIFKFSGSLNIQFDKKESLVSIEGNLEPVKVYHGYFKKFLDLKCSKYIFTKDKSDNIICADEPLAPLDVTAVNFRDGRWDMKFDLLISPKGKIISAKSFKKNAEGEPLTLIEISYYKNGSPKKLSCNQNFTANFSNIDESISCDKTADVLFYSNWAVRAHGYDSRTIDYKIGGQEMDYDLLAPNSSCKFAKHYEAYSNGVMKAFWLDYGVAGIKMADGTETYIKGETDLVFLSEYAEIIEIKRNACNQ
jgi:hypothetical protein